MANINLDYKLLEASILAHVQNTAAVPFLHIKRFGKVKKARSFECVKCGCKIPPGKAGRKCKLCRGI